MTIKPWFAVAVPHEDLRRRRSLDVAQFAVKLDRVVAGDAPEEYTNATKFMTRTFVTDGLQRIASEVLRRLAGEREAANSVLNLVTGFGGGKSHALTYLYHLAVTGPAGLDLPSVAELLRKSGLSQMPSAAVAVFVGSDWNAATGRGDGDQHRSTPWGDIAWQLARANGDPTLFDAMRPHDQAMIAPGKEAIRDSIPRGRPTLILMDEVMNFMTRARGVRVGGSTLASQFFEYIHNLTEEANSRNRLCLVLSLPSSEGEMSSEDQMDFTRLQNVTTRVAMPYVLARDLEIPEIVRRRLFEEVGSESDIREVSRVYARWIDANRRLLPIWFPFDDAAKLFASTYPFHPTVLSVFERKWQTLPYFQRTRGILRLLAQWVSILYGERSDDTPGETLITLGRSPLDDQFFRTAVLDQLRNDALDAPIVTDIAGRDAIAERLDEQAPDAIRIARVHRKAAASIFFEFERRTD